jgi:hypothetical protein
MDGNLRRMRVGDSLGSELDAGMGSRFLRYAVPFGFAQGPAPVGMTSVFCRCRSSFARNDKGFFAVAPARVEWQGFFVAVAPARVE